LTRPGTGCFAMTSSVRRASAAPQAALAAAAWEGIMRGGRRAGIWPRGISVRGSAGGLPVRGDDRPRVDGGAAGGEGQPALVSYRPGPPAVQRQGVGLQGVVPDVRVYARLRLRIGSLRPRLLAPGLVVSDEPINEFAGRFAIQMAWP
jgi:hypothetical protein